MNKLTNSQLLTELRGVLRGSEGVDEPIESIDGGVDLKYSRSHRLGGVLLAVDQLPPGRQATARFQILKAHLFFLSTSPPINPQPPAPPLSFPRKAEETSPKKKGQGPEKREFAQFAQNLGELRQIFRARRRPRIGGFAVMRWWNSSIREGAVSLCRQEFCFDGDRQVGGRHVVGADWKEGS